MTVYLFAWSSHQSHPCCSPVMPSAKQKRQKFVEWIKELIIFHILKNTLNPCFPPLSFFLYHSQISFRNCLYLLSFISIPHITAPTLPQSGFNPQRSTKTALTLEMSIGSKLTSSFSEMGSFSPWKAIANHPDTQVRNLVQKNMHI